MSSKCALLSFLLTLSFARASNVCYNLDGTVLANAYRCDNITSGDSACCSPGSVCWSNGVCQDVVNGVQDYQRIGCTDATWTAAVCLRACQTQPKGKAEVRPCGGILASGDYCCAGASASPSDNSCCKTSSALFTLTIPTIVAQLPLSGSGTGSTSTVSSVSTSATTNPYFFSSQTSSTASDADSGPSNNELGLKIGLGLGIPLGLALIGGLVFTLFYMRRQVKRKERALATASAQTGGVGGQGTVPTNKRALISAGAPRSKPFLGLGRGKSKTGASVTARGVPVMAGDLDGGAASAAYMYEGAQPTVHESGRVPAQSADMRGLSQTYAGGNGGDGGMGSQGTAVLPMQPPAKKDGFHTYRYG